MRFTFFLSYPFSFFFSLAISLGLWVIRLNLYHFLFLLVISTAQNRSSFIQCFFEVFESDWHIRAVHLQFILSGFHFFIHLFYTPVFHFRFLILVGPGYHLFYLTLHLHIYFCISICGTFIIIVGLFIFWASLHMEAFAELSFIVHSTMLCIVTLFLRKITVLPTFRSSFVYFCRTFYFIFIVFPRDQRLRTHINFLLLYARRGESTQHQLLTNATPGLSPYNAWTSSLSVGLEACSRWCILDISIINLLI